jgi:hypothetical protein
VKAQDVAHFIFFFSHGIISWKQESDLQLVFSLFRFKPSNPTQASHGMTSNFSLSTVGYVELGVWIGRVRFGSDYIILLYFVNRSESNLNLDQKILTHTRPTGHGLTQPDSYKIIKYLLIIFI